MIKKKGSAVWQGTLKEGKGTISTETGVMKNEPYGFNTRFEGKKGTNPEELIAAAHASCFSMALSVVLAEHDLVADEISTTATVSLEQVDGDFTITKSHLDLTAKIPGANEATFKKAAEAAKANCPVSRLLKAEITLDAKLKN
ncbi:MAG: OsmC family protein [Paracoccaceae bacterium]